MDAFGAAVNAFSLIDLSSRLVIKLAAYVSDVKSAEDSRKRFAAELVRNVQVLEALKSLLQRLQEESSPKSKDRLKAAILFFEENATQTSNLYKELKAFVDWVEKDTTSQKRMGIFQKMKWPMQGKKKVEKLIPELSRNVELFTLMLSIESCHSSIEVRRMLEDITSITYSSREDLHEIHNHLHQLESFQSTMLEAGSAIINAFRAFGKPFPGRTKFSMGHMYSPPFFFFDAFEILVPLPRVDQRCRKPKSCSSVALERDRISPVARVLPSTNVNDMSDMEKVTLTASR